MTPRADIDGRNEENRDGVLRREGRGSAGVRDWNGIVWKGEDLIVSETEGRVKERRELLDWVTGAGSADRRCLTNASY